MCSPHKLAPEPGNYGTYSKEIYSGEIQPVGTMAICSLEEDRTLYRHLLEKELENGKHLLQEREENSENKVQNKDVSKCICRLYALQQKLEDTGERLSILIEGQEQEDEVLEKIQNDWDLITVVMDYRDELVNLKFSLQEQEASRDNSPISSLDQTLVQLTAKVKHVLNGQPQLQHQQLSNLQSNDTDVAVRCSNETHAGGKLSLGGGPGLACKPCSQQGQILKMDQDLGGGRDLTIGRGRKFGADQGLGGGPRMENDLCREIDPTVKCDLSRGEGPYLRKDSISGGQRLGTTQTKMRPMAIKISVSRKRKRARQECIPCKMLKDWFKAKLRKVLKTKTTPSPRKGIKITETQRQKGQSNRHGYTKKCKLLKRSAVNLRSMSSKGIRLRRNLSLGRGVRRVLQLGRGPVFKRDLSIKILSLGRGPILMNWPDKSRL